MQTHFNIDALIEGSYQMMLLDIRIKRLERINNRSYYMEHQNKSKRSRIKTRNKKFRKK